MSDVINLGSKRPPVVYAVTIVHHYDDTLEFRIEDVADDERSRKAVMLAFRRISGADEEIEKLRTDLRNAINCDSEYVNEIERQNAALRAENEKLRAALKPFAELSLHTGSMSNSDGVCVYVGDLRAAKAALGESYE